jgi:hypothetical protein
MGEPLAFRRRVLEKIDMKNIDHDQQAFVISSKMEKRSKRLLMWMLIRLIIWLCRQIWEAIKNSSEL